MTLSEMAEAIENLQGRVYELERNRFFSEKKTSKFQRPTLQEVQGYMSEKLRGTDGFRQSQSEMFVNHYEANGWLVGKVPMKDWKAAIRNWIKNIENRTFNADYTRTAGKKPVPQGNVPQGGFGQL